MGLIGACSNISKIAFVQRGGACTAGGGGCWGLGTTKSLEEVQPRGGAELCCIQVVVLCTLPGQWLDCA